MSGSSIVSETVDMANFDIDSFTVAGCGWSMIMDGPSLESFKSTCSSSSAKNSISIADADFAHGSVPDHVIDGRNSHITVGESISPGSSIRSGTTKSPRLEPVPTWCSSMLTSTATLIRTPAETPATVPTMSPRPAATRRWCTSVGSPTCRCTDWLKSTKVYKQDHVVSATLLDSSLNELFEVGSHMTDADGNTSVWVVVEDSDGTAYEDHIVRAFGTAGQNETTPMTTLTQRLASAGTPAVATPGARTSTSSWSLHLSCSTTQPWIATSRSPIRSTLAGP